MEPYLADPDVLVGVDASTPEVLMVEIRIAVTDTARVHGLMRRPGGLFDRSLALAQMRADREKRATVLNAEGVRQSEILEAEGAKQSAILRAEGDRQSQILRAEGQAKAIEKVFGAIHAGDADPKLLACQYLQMLPQIAQGDSNKIWLIPTEFSHALEGFQEQFTPTENGKASIPSVTKNAAGRH